jgi:hypothetical protein
MSGAWKDLERLVAAALHGKRQCRGADFSKSDIDVRVEDFPSLKVDAKYRQRWAHHQFVAEVARKYCVEAEDVPVLVTKTPGQKGAIVCLQLEHFAALLDVIRELRAVEM